MVLPKIAEDDSLQRAILRFDNESDHAAEGRGSRAVAWVPCAQLCVGRRRGWGTRDASVHACLLRL